MIIQNLILTIAGCENSKCIGAQLCSQRAPGGNVSCCDFFDNDTCVTRTCGNFLVPRLPDFTCGKNGS